MSTTDNTVSSKTEIIIFPPCPLTAIGLHDKQEVKGEKNRKDIPWFLYSLAEAYFSWIAINGNPVILKSTTKAKIYFGVSVHSVSLW